MRRPPRPPSRAQRHTERAASPDPRRPTEARRPPPEATPAGMIWLHGLHSVIAALENPARRLRRLLLTQEAHKDLSARLPAPWRVQPEVAERAHFAAFLPEDSVHQGAALLVEPLEQLDIHDAIDAGSGPILVLDQVTDPRNVGAMLRSAAAFGASAVVMQDRHAPPETGTLARAASGALELVPMIRVVNLARALEELKKNGLWVVGLDGTAPTTLAQAGLAGRRVALVLGAEGEGMRRLTRENCDELARLPISERMESLNVSAAAAVALYELGRL